MSGGISPFILHLETKYGWIVSLTSRPLYFRRNHLGRLPSIKRLGGSQIRCGLSGKNSLLSLPEIENWIVQPVAQSLHLLSYVQRRR